MIGRVAYRSGFVKRVDDVEERRSYLILGATRLGLLPGLES